jgi:hypothetical protein
MVHTMKITDWIKDNLESIVISGICAAIFALIVVLVPLKPSEPSSSDRLKRIETKLNAILNQEQVNQTRIMGLSIQIDKLRAFPELGSPGPNYHFTYPTNTINLIVPMR